MADQEPVSWQALQEIKSRLALILLDDGFHTDLGAGEVLTSRQQAFEAEAPFTLLRATSIDPIDASSGPKTKVSRMGFTIEYVLPLTGEIDADLLSHRGRADIVRVLSDDLRTAAVRIHNLVVEGSDIEGDVDARGASVLIAQVTARVDLTETKHPVQ